MISRSTLENIGKLNSKRRHVKVRSKKGKEYEYDYANSKLLFRKTKLGYKLIDTAWKDFENSIKKAAKNDVEARSLINEARAVRDSILQNESFGSYGKGVHYSGRTQKGWHRIDVTSMISRISAFAAEKYLTNMGLTTSEIKEYVYLKTGKVINEVDLINDGKWIEGTDSVQVTATDGSTLTLTIHFSYNGVEAIQIR